MAVPNRYSRLSQFWLPTLLFGLSVVSILFTLRNDDIPVIGPKERTVLDSSDLEAHRYTINQALQGAGSWKAWCENSTETAKTIAMAQFDTLGEDERWSQYRRYLPQAEQDALLRCHNPRAQGDRPIKSCIFFVPKSSAQASAEPGLFLLELTTELRGVGRKNLISCAEALADGSQAIELDFFYSYYWTLHAQKKSMQFERLTGGVRIFPPLALSAPQSSSSSRAQ